jgi:MFS family permease
MTLASYTKTPLPRAFYISLWATLFFALGLTIVLPIVPLYVTDELGLAERWIGTATLAVAWTATAMRIPSGTLSDRRGRRILMLAGALSGVLGAVIYVFSHSVGFFLAGRVLTGISISLFTTAGKALAADLSPPERRGEAMGLTNAAFMMAMVVSPLAGEWLKNNVGFQAVFVAHGTLIAAAMLITLLLPSTKPVRLGNRGTQGDIKAILNERGIWASVTTMLGMGAVMTLMFTFYPLMADRKDLFTDAPGWLSGVAMGLGLSIWASVDTIVEPVVGSISDRFGRRVVTLPGLLTIAVGLIALGMAGNTLGTYLGIAILAIGWGAVRAMADVTAQDVLEPMLRGLGAAVIYTGFDMAVGLNAQIVSGLIDGSDFSRLFYATGIIAAMSGIVGFGLTARIITYDQRVSATLSSSD